MGLTILGQRRSDEFRPHPLGSGIIQAEPVLLSKEEADLVRKGMQLEAFVNANAPADAVLVNLWKQQGAQQPRVLEGISLPVRRDGVQLLAGGDLLLLLSQEG